MSNHDSARLLAEKLCNQAYVIMTNYFPLVQYLIAKGHDEIIVPGGQYQKNNAMLCHPSESVNNFYCADHMFVCADGITEQGAFQSDVFSGMCERQMVSVSTRITVILQKNAINHAVGSKIANLDAIHSVLVCEDVEQRVLDELKARNIKVIRV
ncbi:hypothetical protein L3Q72_22595 [Vibrio sp. JC009]|uniref:hypothetical protein n=1 Tax=Vibrio sp. JC009 TaxID=2912314 RepID=UPI0023AF595D|nr:hypothetical protein [Vibrio sp. JC009]WED25004.1 hypothetical protein L3Q72_22595 [Vibrio sp. JC009]